MARTLLGRGEKDWEYRESRGFEKKPLSACGRGLARGTEYTDATSAAERELLEDFRTRLRSRFSRLSDLRFLSRSSLSSFRRSTCSTIMPFSRRVTSRE